MLFWHGQRRSRKYGPSLWSALMLVEPLARIPTSTSCCLRQTLTAFGRILLGSYKSTGMQSVPALRNGEMRNMVQRGRGESGLLIVVGRWSLRLLRLSGQTQIH
jgi:hypothetical protein